jgi:hypothetical protein
MADFQATGRAQRQQAILPAHPRPVRVFRQDEPRVGWLTGRRQRLTACGVPPVGAVPHIVQWWSGDGAVAPTPGERCFLALPPRHATGFQRFMDAFAQAFADRVNILLLDNSGAPTAPRRLLPANVRLVCLPPSGPELPPSAPVRRERKDDLAWQPFIAGPRPPDDGGRWWQAYDAPTRPSLSGDVDVGEARQA